MPPSPRPRPPFVVALEAVYGPPSQTGFGSAVFFDAGPPAAPLEQLARDRYRTFLGDQWDRRGPATWLANWAEVYHQAPDGPRDVVAALRASNDRPTRNHLDVMVDAVDDPTRARQALAAAFDAPEVTELRVFRLGDGAALEGLLLAGRRQTGEVVCLVSLYD